MPEVMAGPSSAARNRSRMVATGVIGAGIDGVIINMPNYHPGPSPWPVRRCGTWSGFVRAPSGPVMRWRDALPDAYRRIGRPHRRVEDVANRSEKRTHPGATPTDKHKVVIIGSALRPVAKKLKVFDVDIKMIAKTTHHLFQPLLYQVATGIISEGEIALLTRVVLRDNKNARFCSARSPTSTWPTRPSTRFCSATPTGPRTTV